MSGLKLLQILVLGPIVLVGAAIAGGEVLHPYQLSQLGLIAPPMHGHFLPRLGRHEI